MKIIIFALLSLFVAGFAHAGSNGAVLIYTNNAQAKLLINESMEDGALSQLFDQMKIKETGNTSTKKKFFQLSNARFELVCNKGLSISSPPSTSCVFTILAGENNTSVNTSISKIGTQKVASIETTEILSKELSGIFPADAKGTINYFLKLDNGIIFEVNGSASDKLTLAFSTL